MSTNYSISLHRHNWLTDVKLITFFDSYEFYQLDLGEVLEQAEKELEENAGSLHRTLERISFLLQAYYEEAVLVSDAPPSRNLEVCCNLCSSSCIV